MSINQSHLQIVLKSVAKIYKHLLIPPSLKETRIKRQKRTNKYINSKLKLQSPIKKKTKPFIKKRKRLITNNNYTKTNGWNIADENGITFATIENNEDYKMTDEELINHKINNDNNDKERISELELQLSELKKSLALLQPNTNQNINYIPPPIPSSSITSLEDDNVLTDNNNKNDILTPCFKTSPLMIEGVPAPNFDNTNTPKTPLQDKTNTSNKKVLTPKIPSPPKIPPPPIIQQSKTFSHSDINLCKTVPSGLQRTQSITDLISTGKASQNILKKVIIVRSPGGTPVKNNKSSGNIIAQALKAKFKNIYASSLEDEDKENTKNIQQTSSLPSFYKKNISSDSVVSDSEWDYSPINSPK